MREAVVDAGCVEVGAGGHAREVDALRDGAGGGCVEGRQFEVLETLDEAVTPMALNDVLKERHKHWAAELRATKI